MPVDERLLRPLVPAVIGVLVRRGATSRRPRTPCRRRSSRRGHPGADDAAPRPRRAGWSPWRGDASSTRTVRDARRGVRSRLTSSPAPGPTERPTTPCALFFLCAHPALTPASAVALTLRAVGGLTTGRSRRPTSCRGDDGAVGLPSQAHGRRARPEGTGDLATCSGPLPRLRRGLPGEVDLAAEAIGLTRRLVATSHDPEAAGLLALMLLHHARRPALRDAGRPPGPARRAGPRSWDTAIIAEGVAGLQRRSRRTGREYQLQAAIAALTPTRALRRRPTGCRSCSGTTSCWR